MIILMWLTRPSTGPEFQRVLRPLEHRIPVFLQTGGEGMQAGQVRGADGDDPVFEVPAGAGLKDLCEAAAIIRHILNAATERGKE
ncbi:MULTISPECIES: hypothetical protein [unclassified Streptomyces]|uniref:hypothetical protein n=1 Tax=unclassified Streptomyces TaxID=2593676 RepID=UPI0033A6E755